MPSCVVLPCNSDTNAGCYAQRASIDFGCLMLVSYASGQPKPPISKMRTLETSRAPEAHCTGQVQAVGGMEAQTAAPTSLKIQTSPATNAANTLEGSANAQSSLQVSSQTCASRLSASSKQARPWFQSRRFPRASSASTLASSSCSPSCSAAQRDMRRPSVESPSNLLT